MLSQNVWIKHTSIQKQSKTHALEGQKPCAYQCLITFWIKSPWQPPKRNTETEIIIKSPQLSPKLPEIMPRPMPRPMPRCKETVLSCPPKANSSLSSTWIVPKKNMLPGQEFDIMIYIYIYDIMANLPTNIYHPCAKTHHPKKGSAPLENHPRWGFSRKSGHWKLGIEILENLGWNHLRKFRPEGPGMRTGWALILWGLKSWNTSWFSEQNLGIKQQPSKLMI